MHLFLWVHPDSESSGKVYATCNLLLLRYYANASYQKKDMALNLQLALTYSSDRKAGSHRWRVACTKKMDDTSCVLFPPCDDPNAQVRSKSLVIRLSLWNMTIRHMEAINSKASPSYVQVQA